VSDSVVSNVSEYVDLVKEEAEALSARVQGELDAVQDQVTQRASSMFSVAEYASRPVGRVLGPCLTFRLV
jgi:hypothetical protein